MYILYGMPIFLYSQGKTSRGFKSENLRGEAVGPHCQIQRILYSCIKKFQTSMWKCETV